MNKYLIIYDIKDYKRLRKVAKLMESYAVRVQKSVFEMEANINVLTKLRKRVRKVIAELDSVVYFDICEKDWQKKEKYGPSKFLEIEERPYYIL
jgi:CRISPR-associated protein Cas2